MPSSKNWPPDSRGASAGAACGTGFSTNRGSPAGSGAGTPLPHPGLAEIRAELSRRFQRDFGAIGCNYYRDGTDSVAAHRDQELRYLDDTLVAIVTCGGQRPFLIRPRGGGRSIDLRPGSGDLLVMGGACQRDWEHGVPKVAASNPRISVSLRWAAPPAPAAAKPRPRA